MTKSEIEKKIDEVFDSSFSEWENEIGTELRPNSFSDEYSWLKFKKILEINNNFLKSALKDSLSAVLSE